MEHGEHDPRHAGKTSRKKLTEKITEISKGHGTVSWPFAQTVKEQRFKSYAFYVHS